MFNKILGFTLTELMITLAVVAISVTLALPSFANLAQKRKVTGAVNEISSFLNYAQSEAVKRHEKVTVSVKRNLAGTNWCIGAVNEAQKLANNLDHCECDVAPGHTSSCSVDGQLQTITQAEFENVTMDALIGGNQERQNIHFNFDPLGGLKISDVGSTVDTERHAFSV